MARGAPRITHILFADDTYIFSKAKEGEADHIVDLLRIFERVSGRKLTRINHQCFLVEILIRE